MTKTSTTLIVLLGAAAGLSGCTSAVVIESDFPTPLVERLPVRMGLMFDPELRNFIHAETLPPKSTWTIDLGDANISLLEPLFSSMFESTRDVDSLPLGSGEGDLDGVIRSELDRFEFDVPVGQRDAFVEVWLQYKFTIYEPNGDVVAEWPVTGYGKSELMRNQEDAVRRAAIVAMREAGATISTQFATQPDISYWLQERENATALSADRRSAN